MKNSKQFLFTIPVISSLINSRREFLQVRWRFVVYVTLLGEIVEACYVEVGHEHLARTAPSFCFCVKFLVLRVFLASVICLVGRNNTSDNDTLALNEV